MSVAGIQNICLTFLIISSFSVAIEAKAEGAGGDEPGVTSGSSKTPSVGIDRLLTLPKSNSYREERYGGLSRSEWIERFTQADSAVEKAKRELLETQDKLDAAANQSSGWQVAPPGAPAGEGGTASFQLVQQVRRHREEVEVAERKRRELIVEANLAGVPEDWYSSTEKSN